MRPRKDLSSIQMSTLGSLRDPLLGCSLLGEEVWGDALRLRLCQRQGEWARKAGLGVPLTGVAQDSAFHESWLIFFPLLPPPLSLSSDRLRAQPS